MKTPRYVFTINPECDECFGQGIVGDFQGEKCPSCEEMSKDEYEYQCDKMHDEIKDRKLEERE